MGCWRMLLPRVGAAPAFLEGGWWDAFGAVPPVLEKLQRASGAVCLVIVELQRPVFICSPREGSQLPWR